ncbi:MAG: SRPBCC family protein [Gemmatimonadota bacterium]
MLTILGILVGLIAVVLLVALLKPATFRIERFITMAAQASKVFPLINDFHNWGAWSPWERLDPDLKRTYSGAANGAGAIYEWEGTPKVGTGRMEILHASAPNEARIQLDFYKPFEAHNIAEFTLQPDGDGTRVTWAMYGPNPFMMKVVKVFMNMERVVGKDFERGLQNMKGLAER